MNFQLYSRFFFVLSEKRANNAVNPANLVIGQEKERPKGALKRLNINSLQLLIGISAAGLSFFVQ